MQTVHSVKVHSEHLTVLSLHLEQLLLKEVSTTYPKLQELHALRPVQVIQLLMELHAWQAKVELMK
jgi:hypothetical protein